MRIERLAALNNQGNVPSANLGHGAPGRGSSQLRGKSGALLVQSPVTQYDGASTKRRRRRFFTDSAQDIAARLNASARLESKIDGANRQQRFRETIHLSRVEQWRV